MHVVEITGDAFVHAAGMRKPVFAHGVNTQGVMGKGVAKTVREYWPALYEEYRQVCHNGLLAPGGFMAWTTPKGALVYNLATQDQLGAHARLEWVLEAVQAMDRHASSIGITKITMVRVGCGIGGLDWTGVKKALEQLDGKVTLEVVSPATSGQQNLL